MGQRDIYWISTIIVILMSMLTIYIINSRTELKKLQLCQQVRIRPFAAEFFTGVGINKLASEGKLQPLCL